MQGLFWGLTARGFGAGLVKHGKWQVSRFLFANSSLFCIFAELVLHPRSNGTVYYLIVMIWIVKG
jgi:hypothetical protein